MAVAAPADSPAGGGRLIDAFGFRTLRWAEAIRDRLAQAAHHLEPGVRAWFDVLPPVPRVEGGQGEESRERRSPGRDRRPPAAFGYADSAAAAFP